MTFEWEDPNKEFLDKNTGIEVGTPEESATTPQPLQTDPSLGSGQAPESVVSIDSFAYGKDPFDFENFLSNNQKYSDAVIYAASKKGMFVDDDIVGNNPQDWEDDEKGVVLDPLRRDSARYWSPIENIDDGDMLGWTGDMPYDPTETIFGKTYFTPPEYGEEGLFEISSTETLEVFMNKAFFRELMPRTPEVLYDGYVGNTIEVDKFYFDHAFEVDLPFNKKDIDMVATIGRPVYASLSSDYNFYQEGYEEYIATPVVDETVLPNLYVYSAYAASDSTNSDVQTIATLSGAIKQEAINVFKRFFVDPKVLKKYYQTFANLVSDSTTQINNINDASIKWKNMIFPTGDMNLLQSYNERQEMFPMNTEIEFSTDRKTTIAQMFWDTDLMNKIVADISSDNIEFQEKAFIGSFQSTKDVGTSVDRKIKIKNNLSRFPMRIYDFDGWYEKLLDDDFSVETDKVFFVSLSGDPLEKTAGPEYKFYRNLLKSVLHAKMKQFVKDKMRTYRDVTYTPFIDYILRPKVTTIKKPALAYSETLFYRIRKFDTANNVLQDVYLPNSNDVDILTYIDTQVKYNKGYRYLITAFEFIIGSKYQYKNKRADEYNTASPKLRIDIETLPSLKIVEVPYYNSFTGVVDAPPIFPDVNFIPYRGVDNKIKIDFMSNAGTYHMKPILIEPTDTPDFLSIIAAQKTTLGFDGSSATLARELLDRGEKITFKNDDLPTRFQVFRVDSHPKSWNDFTGRIIKEVETDFSPISKQKASSASYVDNIMPNKKYWYIFRTVDNHGHVSNPTSIYQVEMVNQEGAIFPLIEVVDFADANPATPAKTLKRFIKISPSFQQSIVNAAKSGFINMESAHDVQNVYLGVSEESIWGKTFKMRVTSRSSGKKVDVNFRFVNNVKTNITEE